LRVSAFVGPTATLITATIVTSATTPLTTRVVNPSPPLVIAIALVALNPARHQAALLPSPAKPSSPAGVLSSA
jgi:hypothetical protein